MKHMKPYLVTDLVLNTNCDIGYTFNTHCIEALCSGDAGNTNLDCVIDYDLQLNKIEFGGQSLINRNSQMKIDWDTALDNIQLKYNLEFRNGGRDDQGDQEDDGHQVPASFHSFSFFAEPKPPTGLKSG